MKIITLCSLLLSLLHSVLFWGNRFGISVMLFTVTAIFTLITILHESKKIKNKKALWLSIPIILISSTYFLFNNTFFNITNIIIIFILLSLMLVLSLLDDITPARVISKIFLVFIGPIDYLRDAKKVAFSSLRFKLFKGSNIGKNKSLLKQIFKGFLFSIPLLIIILFLLMNADDVFANIFIDIFKSIFGVLNFSSIFSFICRIIVVAILALYFVAFILNLFSKSSPFNTDYFDNNEYKFKICIQSATINTMLTLLNIIYAIFAYTQFSQICTQINSASADYAQFARVGFFELMAVSVINFIVILITKNNNSEQSNFGKSFSKIMNILVAFFTVVILFSSVFRMRLYEQLYGYTFLRLMVYFTQITELVLIIPTFAYIINKKINLFKSFIVICTVSYVCINFVNIDSLIARGNINRYLENDHPMSDDISFVAYDLSDIDGLDLAYLESLSTDAVPEIAKILDSDKASNFLKYYVKLYLRNVQSILREEDRNVFELNFSKEIAQNLLIND